MKLLQRFAKHREKQDEFRDMQLRMKKNIKGKYNTGARYEGKTASA